MLNCHADGSAATEAAAAVIWYVCASDMGIRIPVRASHATCCEARLRLVTHSKGSEKRVVSSSIKSDSITESKSP